MGRAPCCEKMGLKKGPWTPQEDQILVSHIYKFGHENWRALPKQAGLLRCGKSCRLRWTNYLRPDIKRGNFSREEEETIIKLHELLGNRWSTIASKLPGRTDNEIKNVWHTHLKKRLKKAQQNPARKSNPMNLINSPKPSLSEFPSDNNINNNNNNNNARRIKDEYKEEHEHEPFQEIDESFWSDELSVDNFITYPSNISMITTNEMFQYEITPNMELEYCNGKNSNRIDESMDFWFNLFIRAGGQPELPDF